MSSLWVHIIVDNLVGNLPFNFLLRTHNFDELRYRYMQRVVLPLFTSLINHVLSACKYRISMPWRSTKFARLRAINVWNELYIVIGNGRARTRYEFDIEKHLALQLIENRQIIEFGASVTRKTRRLISDISHENVRIYLEIHASTLQSCSLQNALNFISGVGMIPKLF